MSARILVIDDNEIWMSLIKRSLKSRPYEIAEAAGAEEALELMAKESFDLIISDYFMPNMDGLQFVNEMKKRFPDGRPPVIMLTAVRSKDVRNQGKEAGIECWLNKPVSKDTLINSVEELLEERG
ncbi:MAG: response regulator [Ignavibacteriales bacterium]|nr:response regulator [Ignavibacteriales bacterium]